MPYAIISHALIFLHNYIAWLRCFNGVLTRGAIESLFVTWTDCSEDFCQVVAESGVLRDSASSLHWALEHEALNRVCMHTRYHWLMCNACP